MDRNQQLGELWLEAFAAERGAADGTLKAYGECLDFYLRFLGERGLTVGEVTQDIIRDYLGYLGSIGYADKTIEGHLAVVRARAARTKVPHLLIGGKGDKDAAPPDAAHHSQRLAFEGVALAGDGQRIWNITVMGSLWSLP